MLRHETVHFFRMFSKDLSSMGETINISAITATNHRRHKTLECDEVCQQLQRVVRNYYEKLLYMRVSIDLAICHDGNVQLQYVMFKISYM